MSYSKEQLLQFAELLARGTHSFSAALSIVGKDNTSEAVAVHEMWRNDPIVIAEVARLKNDGIEANLPSKTDILNEIHEAAKKCKDPKAQAQLYALYSDMRGFIGKNALVQVNNVTNKVMVVNSSRNDEDWADKAHKQQLRLIKGSVAVNG